MSQGGASQNCGKLSQDTVATTPVVHDDVVTPIFVKGQADVEPPTNGTVCSGLDSPGTCIPRRLPSRRRPFGTRKWVLGSAQRRPALGLLVLAQRQHYPPGYYRRPRGHAACGHRGGTDHGGRPGHADGTGAVRQPRLARIVQARLCRGRPAGPEGQHEQRCRLVRQRGTVDHAPVGHAKSDLDGNRRGRPPALRGAAAAAQHGGPLLSRHRRAGLSHAGRKCPHREHQQQSAVRSDGSLAGLTGVVGGRSGRADDFPPSAGRPDGPFGK